jgi:CheY-like chemotaxis protein
VTTVLVVDDSAVDRALIGGLLGDKPHWTVQEAGNGAEALARIQAAVPDVVVTDLQMPEMDGLELVTVIRRQHPNVPVILMTAYGSETLAVEALEKGAAGYVPKSLLAGKLVNTMEKVLALARADRDYGQLLDCLTSTEFAFSLRSDAALIDPLVGLVQHVVGGIWACDFAERLQIGMALREALINALFHGSLEIDPNQMQEALDKLRRGEKVSLIEDPRSQPAYRDRRIFVDVRISPEQARFLVRDEGPGFDVAAVPKARGPEALEPGRGRGLALMRTFMDEVTYNQAGNEVTMVKRRNRTGGNSDCSGA